MKNALVATAEASSSSLSSSLSSSSSSLPRLPGVGVGVSGDPARGWATVTVTNAGAVRDPAKVAAALRRFLANPPHQSGYVGGGGGGIGAALWDRTSSQVSYMPQRSPLHGVGLGLGLSALHAAYLGGSLAVQSHRTPPPPPRGRGGGGRGGGHGGDHGRSDEGSTKEDDGGGSGVGSSVGGGVDVGAGGASGASFGASPDASLGASSDAWVTVATLTLPLAAEAYGRGAAAQPSAVEGIPTRLEAAW